MTRQFLIALGVMSLELAYQGMGLALDCPKMPEQTSKDVEVDVNAAVAKIGPVSGGELKTKTKNATQDIMGKLPNADKVYLEQMLFASYCSSLRDDKSLSESQKTQRLFEYIGTVRKTIEQQAPKTKQPTLKQPGKDEKSGTQSQVNPPVTSSTQAERERAAKTEKELLELQERIKPRRITDAQRTRLLQALTQSPKGPIRISVPFGDGEARRFAGDFKEILEASGWGNVDISHVMRAGGPSIGLSMVIRDPNKVPSFAQAVIQAFESSGFAVRGAHNPEIPEETLEISVGMKP